MGDEAERNMDHNRHPVRDAVVPGLWSENRATAFSRHLPGTVIAHLKSVERNAVLHHGARVPRGRLALGLALTLVAES